MTGTNERIQEAPDASVGGAGSAPRGAAPEQAEQTTEWEATAPTWEELVRASLLGAERCAPPGGSVEAMLDLAAVHTVRRRAGLTAALPAGRPEPSPPDDRPSLPEAAEHRLGQLLSGKVQSGWSGSAQYGSTSRFGVLRLGLGELLPEWLALANVQGYRAPWVLLPPLLEAARARTDMREAVLTFAGPRARWLARFNPRWTFALRTASYDTHGTHAGPPRDEASVRLLWEEGLFAERMALLREIRRRDPHAGRELLGTTWSTERAEDRLKFLESLREGLSLADEPFLEAALNDRGKNVRARAADLLCALPHSALSDRMSRRARTCVSLDRTGGVEQLVVEPPHECDKDMLRDGIVREPPRRRGERSWWVTQLVERAPLSDWSAHLGGRRPQELLTLPVADDWKLDLHLAWANAAVRQGDATWAAALLAGLSDTAIGKSGDTADLLALLPEEPRVQWTVDFIATHGLEEAFSILQSCPTPWPARLGQAVVEALEIAGETQSYRWSLRSVVELAERCLEPEQTDQLVPLAAGAAERDRGAPGSGVRWSDGFERLLVTVRIRAKMRAELLAGSTSEDAAARAG